MSIHSAIDAQNFNLSRALSILDCAIRCYDPAPNAADIEASLEAVRALVQEAHSALDRIAFRQQRSAAP